MLHNPYHSDAIGRQTMKKPRSIKYRLARATRKEAVKATLDEWFEEWKNSQNELIDLVESANDLAKTRQYAGVLKTVTEKRFDGLKTVIDDLTERITDAETPDTGRNTSGA